jgi:nucleotide-binding universal stress UspA family protein
MRVLLALSTTRHSEKAIEKAIERVEAESGELFLLFILDDEVPSGLFDQLTDRGFTGEKPSDQLANALKEEYRLRAREETQRIESRAAERNLKCHTEIVEGAFQDKCLEGVERYQADLVILTRRKRSNLARYLFGSAVNNLKAVCQCGVEIIDD